MEEAHSFSRNQDVSSTLRSYEPVNIHAGENQEVSGGHDIEFSLSRCPAYAISASLQ